MSDSTMPQGAATRIRLLRTELEPRYQRLRDAMCALPNGDDLAQARFDLALADVQALVNLIRQDKQVRDDAERYRYLRNISEAACVVTADGDVLRGTHLDDVVDPALSLDELLGGQP